MSVLTFEKIADRDGVPLISPSPHHPPPHPPNRKSREYNFLGQPHLQFQHKLTSEDILSRLLI